MGFCCKISGVCKLLFSNDLHQKTISLTRRGVSGVKFMPSYISCLFLKGYIKKTPPSGGATRTITFRFTQ